MSFLLFFPARFAIMKSREEAREEARSKAAVKLSGTYTFFIYYKLFQQQQQQHFIHISITGFVKLIE